jgi:MHS family proline/betaine transporter-like MFS transporter
MFGGIIGLCGLFLRSSLHETPLFKDMVSHLKIVKEPIVEMFRYKREIIQACFFPLLCSSGFYLFTVNFPVYFGDLLGISYRDSLLILGVILILITVPLPIFGKIAVKHNYKNMLIYSTALMILLLIPLYIGLVQKNIVLISISIFIFCLAYSCMTSLLPYIFCDLFPTRVRFTCVATSFNIADTVVGGFTPALALFLLNRTGNQGSFCWILLACGLFSLWSFLLIKKDKAPI